MHAPKPPIDNFWLSFFALSSIFWINGAGLETKLDQIVDSNLVAKRSAVGIHVVSLSTKKTLYSRNPDRFFLPASNMKLLSTALALERLGPDFHFTTKLLTDASGNLIFLGGGDPSLSGRDYPYQKEASGKPPLLPVEQLADEAVANGLTRIDGDIIGDDTRYVWDPYPPSWTQDDALGADGAPVSALTVNDNAIALRIAPGGQVGDPAHVSPFPALEYFAIDNRIVTGEARSARKIRVTRTPGTRQVILTGTIPLKGGALVEGLAVDDPALFAACALYDALARRGVEIHGVPVARHRAAGEAFPAPEGMLWAKRDSPPVSELLQVVDKVSQNLHAEMMLREAGKEGTREAGLKALEGLFKESGASLDDARIDDGSGLSRNDQVTPRLVTKVLTHLFDSPLQETFVAMLPVGGEDGTLSHRLCCTSESHKIQAKTGTLNRSVALSGYADSKTYGRLAFSILINNFPASARDVQPWVDKIALALTE